MKRVLAFVAAGLFACGGSSNSTPDATVGGNPDATVGGNPDAAPPATVDPVTSLVVTATTSGIPEAALTWTNPAALAGTLVVRRDLVAPSAGPVDGMTYAVDDALGGGTVVAVGDASAVSADDTSVFGGITYVYDVYAFDAAHTYSTKVEGSGRPTEYYHANISVAADGTVTVTPDADSGAFDLTGTSVVAGNQFTVSLVLGNGTDRIAFNPKLIARTVTGATFDNSDGTFDGSPFKYYGPAGMALAATKSLDWTFTSDTPPFTADVELAINPMIFVSHEAVPALSLIDSGQHLDMLDVPGGAGGFDNNTWFSALSPDMHFLYESSHYANGVYIFDTTTAATVNLLQLAPEGDGDIANVKTAGVALAPAGDKLYVLGSSQQVDGSYLDFISELDVASTGTELRRLALGVDPNVGDAGSLRDLEGDFAGGRLYVAEYGNGQIRVVDLATFTEVDVDGDAGNGVTPITFTDPHLNVSGLALHPDGDRMYVSFGHSNGNVTTDIAEIHRNDLTTVTFLPTSTSPAGASTPRLSFGPDGKLYVPRNQYPEADPSFGISVYDVDANPIVDTQINVVGSQGESNNDLWDVFFVPGTTLGYGVMADSDELMAFDTTTETAVDIDGDAGNGFTYVPTNSACYGGAGIVTW